jgi:hypothetical protein
MFGRDHKNDKERRPTERTESKARGEEAACYIHSSYLKGTLLGGHIVWRPL